MTIDVSRRASIRGYFGASGTGKSTSAKAWLKGRAPDRLLVWDPEGEYDGFGHLCESAELIARLKTGMGTRGFRLRYRPPLVNRVAAFDRFCALALWTAERCGGCVIVADELAEVTGSGKAINGWGALTRTGRKRGVELVACSIRPAEIDKTFYSQCTYIRSGRLTFGVDLARMAGMLGCTDADLAALPDLAYIERDIQGQEGAIAGTIRPAGRSKRASAQ